MTAQAFSIEYAEGVRRELDVLRDLAADLTERATHIWNPSWRNVILVGIGASHAALATPMMEFRRAGITAWRTDGSDWPVIASGAADVAILVSQSGRSQETVRIAEALRDASIPLLAITNSEKNPLVDHADHRLTLGGQPDSRVSTIGFVVTYAALAMLAEAAGEGVRDDWTALPERITTIADSAGALIPAEARAWLASGSVDVVAAAGLSSVAEAVALLFREGPLVPAAAYNTRSYLHGPMDCAGSDVTHLLIGNDRERQLADQLAERTSQVLSTTQLAPDAAELPLTQRALAEVCVLQRLVALAADSRKQSIDEAVFVRQDTKLY